MSHKKEQKFTDTPSGRRKKASDSIINEQRSEETTRRKQVPQHQKIKEQREDMQIIASTSQTDIYMWALSVACMVGIIGVMLTISLVNG